MFTMSNHIPDTRINDRDRLLYSIASRRYSNKNVNNGLWYNHYNRNTIANQGPGPFSVDLQQNPQPVSNMQLSQSQNLNILPPWSYASSLPCDAQPYSNLQKYLLDEYYNIKKADTLNYVRLNNHLLSHPIHTNDMIMPRKEMTPRLNTRQNIVENHKYMPVEVKSSNQHSKLSTLGKRFRQEDFEVCSETKQKKKMKDDKPSASARENLNDNCFSIDTTNITVEIGKNNQAKGSTATHKYGLEQQEKCGTFGSRERISEKLQVTAKKIFGPSSSRFQSPRIYNISRPMRFLCYDYPQDSVRNKQAQIIRAFHALDCSTELVTMEIAFLSLLCLFQVETPEQFVSLASNKLNQNSNFISKGKYIELPAGTDKETEKYLWKLTIEASIAIPHLLKRTLKEFLEEEEPHGPGMSPENAAIITYSIVEIIGIDHLEDISRLTETDLLSCVLNEEGDRMLSQSTAKHLLKHFYKMGEKSKLKSTQIRDLIINGKWLGKASVISEDYSEGDDEDQIVFDEDNYDKFEDDESNLSSELCSEQ